MVFASGFPLTHEVLSLNGLQVGILTAFLIGVGMGLVSGWKPPRGDWRSRGKNGLGEAVSAVASSIGAGLLAGVVASWIGMAVAVVLRVILGG